MNAPRVDSSCYVAPEAVIIGDVSLGKDCSVWSYAVLRADLSGITVSEGSSIQEHCQVHGNPGRSVNIGRYVTVGHGAIVHAATIGDEVVLGMNSSVLDGAEVGSGSVIGANALVKEGEKIPEGCLVVGVPARIIRQGDTTLREAARKNAERYIQLARSHARGEFVRHVPKRV
ncbi:MAG: gamma carbonic anhydrase family protein [Methanobacteriota archaeon]|nr:MAG: gamma carbonic anhydrase family protein [Euryarchaeota archaeon]